MSAIKNDWEDPSSLVGLKIEWDYEPETPHGKRKVARISKKELSKLLTSDKVLVKIHAQGVAATGSLEDISETGFAVLLYKRLTEGLPVRAGFFLGPRKILASATVRNVTNLDGRYRIGMEFIGLGDNDVAFLMGLLSSTVLRY
ncbi:MAG: PilZ domain-containing protein [Desulfofustis sp.]|nr:PilZ domain-containing protein [Desulfofustis sp.]